MHMCSILHLYVCALRPCQLSLSFLYTLCTQTYCMYLENPKFMLSCVQQRATKICIFRCLLATVTQIPHVYQRTTWETYPLLFILHGFLPLFKTSFKFLHRTFVWGIEKKIRYFHHHIRLKIKGAVKFVCALVYKKKEREKKKNWLVQCDI